MVRSLQKTFYNSPNDDENALPRPELQTKTGMLTNLPLWRVGWTEVPGRANCLNVHEGQYTHMFETIVNQGPGPWYFGHLHLPGGFKMTRTGQRRFDLKSWREEIKDKARFQEPERSAVVGTLMRITDFRRLEDGRLCILVHVLERFVVDNVVQSFPYSVADVQILPDLEELPPDIVDENFAKIARGEAVVRSFQYHDYEYDNIKLPLPQDSEYLSTDEGTIPQSEIGKVLPFAFYSDDDSSLDGIEELELDEKSSLSSTGFSGGEPPLENQLLDWRILRNPPSIRSDEKGPKRKAEDSGATETLIWFALEEFCRNTDFILPDEILCLMPPQMESYLDMKSRTPIKLLSEKYPTRRRQRRLSYALPAILESTNIGAGIRQELLNTPSTQTRLSAVLERFRVINDSLMGQLE